MRKTTPHNDMSFTGPLGRRWRTALLLVVAVSAAGSLATPTPVTAELVPLAAEPTVSPLRLVTNVPAFRLDAYLEGELAASFPVTVGSARNPTPLGNYQIEKMIWNPWWHPPAHRRPADRVTPPGPNNPMGRVKIHFASLYFFHGTALENEIGRATSRGCIRMRNDDAITLGRMINEQAGRPLPVGALETLVRQPRQTRNVALPVPVPVTLLYQTVELRHGRVHVHEDIYRQATRPLPDLVVEALVEAGISRWQVDLEAVAAAISAPHPTAFRVEDVLIYEAFGA